MAATAKPVPPYGRRAGHVPRREEDFGGGGAFPEVHVPQYPLSMGLPAAAAGGSSGVLSGTVDAGGGRVAFDAVVRRGENAAKVVYTCHADLVPKVPAPDHHEADEGEGEDEDEDEVVEAVTALTRAALQRIVDAHLSAVQPPCARDDPTAFVRYRPGRQSAALGSGAAERVVRVERAQEDPVLPPKHRRRRVPRAAGSPPVTAAHSPPRPVSREDAEAWAIPPAVSDWKNGKGYTIPLDKRAASDGRCLQDVQVNDGFAGLSEALCVAEQRAREAIRVRELVRGELAMKEKEQRERELRELASRARAERAPDAAPAPPPVGAGGAGNQLTLLEKWEMLKRLAVSEERRREREREKRREASAGQKSEGARDMGRDVSERIALGMASTAGAAGAGEVSYDERLFNQDAGMGSGFAADDQYNVYTGRLFAARPALSTLYRPSKDADSDVYGAGADEQLDKITKTERFKTDKGFSGAPELPAGKRVRPVEFDTPEEGSGEDDPFVELDQYITRVKEGRKH